MAPKRVYGPYTKLGLQSALVYGRVCLVLLVLKDHSDYFLTPAGVGTELTVPEIYEPGHQNWKDFMKRKGILSHILSVSPLTCRLVSMTS